MTLSQLFKALPLFPNLRGPKLNTDFFAHWKQSRHIERMEERMLKDIGLTRDELRRHVDTRVWL